MTITTYADESPTVTASGEEMVDFVERLLQEIPQIILTVDELAVISNDLELPIPLDGGIEFAESSVDFDAARRSLASKGLVEIVDGGTQLAPWLTIMADAASDPLLVVRMRQSRIEETYEWTLFVDHQIGVQQQSGANGLVVWAPFAVTDLVELITDALLLEPGVAQEEVTFATHLETLDQLDELLREQMNVDSSEFPQIPVRYLSSINAADRSTLNLIVIDRTVEDPIVQDLSWARFGSDLWQFEPENPSGESSTSLLISLRSGENILSQILSLLPLGADLDETVP